MAITSLRTWRNGETFTARDYMYERNVLVDEINRLASYFDGTLDLHVNSITIGDATLGYNETYGTMETDLGSTYYRDGQMLHFYGKCIGSVNLGDPVMFAGVSGNKLEFTSVTAANGFILDANPEYFIGVATNNLVDGEEGYVITYGRVANYGNSHMDTTMWNEGDILWVDSINGGYTTTRPGKGYAQIRVAAVVRQHVEQGALIVRPSILESMDGQGVFWTEPESPQPDDTWFDD